MKSLLQKLFGISEPEIEPVMEVALENRFKPFSARFVSSSRDREWPLEQELKYVQEYRRISPFLGMKEEGDIQRFIDHLQELKYRWISSPTRAVLRKYKNDNYTRHVLETIDSNNKVVKYTTYTSNFEF